MSQNGQTHFKNLEANARSGLRSQAWGRELSYSCYICCLTYEVFLKNSRNIFCIKNFKTSRRAFEKVEKQKD